MIRLSLMMPISLIILLISFISIILPSTAQFYQNPQRHHFQTQYQVDGGGTLDKGGSLIQNPTAKNIDANAVTNDQNVAHQSYNKVLAKSAICKHGIRAGSIANNKLGKPLAANPSETHVIILSLNFETPFKGLIYSDGAFEDLNCRYVDGRILPSDHFNLTIALDRCNSEVLSDGTRRNTVVIQRDPRILEAGDNKYILTCNPERLELDESVDRQFTVTLGSVAVDGKLKDSEIVSNPGPAPFNLDYHVAIQLGKGPVGAPVNRPLTIGEPISYVITMNQLQSHDVRVGRCWATDSLSQIQLSDDKGCSLQPLGSQVWSDFQIADTGTTSTAGQSDTVILFNNIKTWAFPTSSRVNIMCNLHVCRQGSIAPICASDSQATLCEQQQQQQLLSAKKKLANEANEVRQRRLRDLRFSETNQVDGMTAFGHSAGDNRFVSNFGDNPGSYVVNAGNHMTEGRQLFGSNQQLFGEERADYQRVATSEDDPVVEVTGGFQVMSFGKHRGLVSSNAWNRQQDVPSVAVPEVVTGQRPGSSAQSSAQGNASNRTCFSNTVFAAGLALILLLLLLSIIVIVISVRRIRQISVKDDKGAQLASDVFVATDFLTKQRQRASETLKQRPSSSLSSSVSHNMSDRRFDDRNALAGTAAHIISSAIGVKPNTRGKPGSPSKQHSSTPPSNASTLDNRAPY